MRDRSTLSVRQENLVEEMAQRMTTLVQQLCTWLHAEERVLAEMETQVVSLSKQMGAALLTGLCSLLAPRYVEPELPCSCGAIAHYQRDRPAQVLTVLGPLHLARP